jgi:hypothetical protein
VVQKGTWYKKVRYKTIRLQNGIRYKTVCVTKRKPLLNGTFYKTEHVTKRYMLQNGTCNKMVRVTKRDVTNGKLQETVLR